MEQEQKDHSAHALESAELGNGHNGHAAEDGMSRQVSEPTQESFLDAYLSSGRQFWIRFTGQDRENVPTWLKSFYNAAVSSCTSRSVFIFSIHS